MKQKILYILMMIVATFSWALEAGAQDVKTYYVIEQLSEQSGGGGATSKTPFKEYTFTEQGIELTFEAKRDGGNLSAFSRHIYVREYDANGKQLSEEDVDGIETSYSKKTYTIKNTATRKIAFYLQSTYTRTVKNVRITRATTLSANSSSLAFGNIKYGKSSNNTINVTFNNTYSDAVLTGTCTNPAFTVTRTNMGETGTQGITITYNANALGQQTGTVTLTMGTLDKNNDVKTTFEVSGTCEIDYNYSSSAHTNNANFGTAQVTLGGQTQSNGTSVNVQETSTTSPLTKDATFNAIPNDGYKFLGWYSDTQYTNRVATSTSYTVPLTASTSGVNPSTTLYAKFEVDKEAAQQAIDDFEDIYTSKTDDPQAAIDLVKAQEDLNNAVTKEDVADAISNLKRFDTVTFDEGVDNNIEKDNALSTIGLATSSNGLSLVYTSSNEDVIKVVNDELQAMGVGSAIITATSTGDGYYSAKSTRSFTVFTAGKNNATITINAPIQMTIDDEATDVFSLSNETITPSVTFSREGILEYVDGVLRAISAGTVTMYVNQAENEDWNPTQAEQEITVVKHDNTVTWADGKSTSMVALDVLDISDYASSTAGAITFSSSNAEVIEVVGHELRAIKSGSAIITATAAETDKYDEASNTLQFTVTKAPTTIRWDQVLPALNDRVQSGVELSAIVVDASGNVVEGAVVLYSSDNTSVVSINGNTLTPRGGGNTSVRATYAGNDVYAAAADVSKHVSVESYSVTTTWVNDWSSAPATNTKFYLYNTTNTKFLKEGQGENQATSFVNAANATLWLYATDRKIASVNNSNNFIANKTNEASTDGTGNVSNYTFNYKNGNFQIQGSAIGQNYDVCNRNGNFSGYHNGSHFEWWLISEAQYNYYMTDIPEAINMLYGEGEYSKYLSVVGTTRDNLVAATHLNSNFGTARTTINNAMQAFKDYVAELERLDAFAETIATNTPDRSAAEADVTSAKSALATANGSNAIKAVYNTYIKKFVTLSAEYATSIPKASVGTIAAVAMSGATPASVTITYTSNDPTVFTVNGNGEIQPLKEGIASITLTTATDDNYYAAMPFTTADIEVTDRLTLSNANVASYISGDYGTVIFNRILKAGYNTLALPFNTTVDAIVGNGYDAENDYVAQLSIVTYNEHDGYTLYFSKGSTIVANEPYILHLANAVENPVFTSVSVAAATSVEHRATTGVSLSAWSMHSNYTPSFDMQGKYGIVNTSGTIMKGGTGSTLNAFSAYITGPTGGSVRTRACFVDGSDATAVLDAIIAEQEAQPEATYDLSGRRISNATPGIRLVRMKDGTVKKVMR